MNTEMLLTIPPVLRGLTFDGEKGAIIVTETGIERINGIHASDFPKDVFSSTRQRQSRAIHPSSGRIISPRSKKARMS